MVHLSLFRLVDDPSTTVYAEPAQQRAWVATPRASLTQGSLDTDRVTTLRPARNTETTSSPTRTPPAEPQETSYNGSTPDIVTCNPTAVTILIDTSAVRNAIPITKYRDNPRAMRQLPRASC
ncbi:hypothetical protein ACFOY2_37870 [Nonomuraea purpurea]|uniref:Uncharacterized protein n=1 Tax=Nonomuraea purpurea TaxID=1849276 RepID=A0ABV8GJE9_9ACTN